MKTLMLAAFLLIGTIHQAQAQVTSIPGQKYREFAVNIAVTSGEVKSAVLQVNTELSVNALGEPEIPHHGHYDYFVTGTVAEGERRCNFEALIAQTTLKQETTSEIIKSSRDRSASIKLCSGLSIEMTSVKALLLEADVMVSMKAPGLTRAIGTGTVSFSGLKTVPEWEPYED